MMLRLALVGLVASLGLELPSARDVDAWARSGREWCSARLAALDDARMPTGVEAFAADPAEGSPAPPTMAGAEDRAFDALMEETVARFSADLAPAKAVTYEPLEVGEDLYPGIAFDLNRDAERSSQPAPEVATQAPAPGAEATVNSRGERLTTAVRLTSQAVNAWVDLLQGPAVVSLQP